MPAAELLAPGRLILEGSVVDGPSFDEYMTWQRSVLNVNRPAMYIAGNGYGEVIASIISNIILRPEVMATPELISVVVQGPLEFELSSTGPGVTKTFEALCPFETYASNMLWLLERRLFSLRKADCGNSWGIVFSLLGWSEELRTSFATADLVHDQTYIMGMPKAETATRPRTAKDRAFFLYARMEPGHFARECMTRAALDILTSTDLPMDVRFASEIPW